MTHKTFACGHAGKGQFCHRCVQEQQLREQQTKAREAAALEKQDWQMQLTRSPIPLQHLPKDMAYRALQIMAGLKQGKSYQEFRGKPLVAMNLRHIISIPIGLNYRMVCRKTGMTLQCLEVIPHEEYSSRLAAGGWK